jgi:hypothetical protein
MHETKEQYVSRRKKHYKEHCRREGKVIDIRIWKDLVAQWEFDYEMERRYGQVSRID